MITGSRSFHSKQVSGWTTNLLVPFLALAMATASPITAVVSYLLIAAYAVKGYSQAVQALTLAWLIGALNPGLAFGGEMSSLGRPLIYLAAAISVFGRNRLVMSKSALWPLTLGILIIFHSLFFSEMPHVSILKASIWALVAATIFEALSKLTQSEMRDFTRWLFVILVTIMVISWPLIVTPVGFLRNGRGFQGVLNHPQTYGVYLAFLAAFTASRILEKEKPPFIYFAILGSTIAALLLSQARTGAVAFLGGLCIALLVQKVLRKRRSVMPGFKSKRTIIVMFIIFAIMIVSIDRWSPFALEFLVKGYEISSFSELYETSRGGLLDRSLINFRENPLTGVGFGIDIVREMNVWRDPFFGLPVSAPIEKGNAFMASLEEVGLILSAVILLWLISQLPRVISGGLAALTMFCAVMLINIAEAVFFAPGGNGLLALLFFGWSINQAPSHIQAQFNRKYIFFRSDYSHKGRSNSAKHE